MRGSWRKLGVVGGLVGVAVGLLVTVGRPLIRGVEHPQDAGTQRVTVDGHDTGRTFQGVGAVSAGGSSRLLTDYPARQRDRILDYLFRPGYGASLQVLKTEIGSDTDTTAGAEASHERARGQVECTTGYEWWLMAQAVRRNPAIKLYALEWSQPAWVHGTWNQANIGYLMAWLRCATRHGLTIDYLGGRDERGYDVAWSVRLAKAIRAAGLPTQVVLGDTLSHPWRPALALASAPAARKYIAAVGVHDACRWRTKYTHCRSPAAAMGGGSALWNSEQSAESYDTGAAPLARALNRGYIDGRMTSYLVWGLVSSSYSDLPLTGTAPVVANTPWSGSYGIGPQVWVDAQTTQFTRVGWRYLDHGCGYLRDGGSYVSLRDPNSGGNRRDRRPRGDDSVRRRAPHGSDRVAGRAVVPRPVRRHRGRPDRVTAWVEVDRVRRVFGIG